MPIESTSEFEEIPKDYGGTTSDTLAFPESESSEVVRLRQALEESKEEAREYREKYEKAAEEMKETRDLLKEMGNIGKRKPRLPNIGNIEAEVLQLLVFNEKMCGFQIINANPVLNKNTVYVALRELSRKGFLESETVLASVPTRGRPQRVYKPTELGVKVFDLFQKTA